MSSRPSHNVPGEEFFALMRSLQAFLNDYKEQRQTNVSWSNLFRDQDALVTALSGKAHGPAWEAFAVESPVNAEEFFAVGDVAELPAHSDRLMVVVAIQQNGAFLKCCWLDAKSRMREYALPSKALIRRAKASARKTLEEKR